VKQSLLPAADGSIRPPCTRNMDTTPSMRHAKFSPGFSLWSAEHRDSPHASPLALAAFAPEQCLLEPLFASAGAEPCFKSSSTNADARFPMCRRCTCPNTGARTGSIAPIPGAVEAPGENHVASPGSGTFHSDTETTLLSSDRLQKPKQLNLLMH